jgi:hypothetical protein
LVAFVGVWELSFWSFGGGCAVVWVRDVRSIMSYGEECTRKVSMEKEARWREVKLVGGRVERDE